MLTTSFPGALRCAAIACLVSALPALAQTGAKEKAMLASNFKLTLPGLETVTSKVSKIEALAIKQKLTVSAIGEKRDVTKEAGTLEVPNLIFSVAESFAAPLYDWHEDFVIKGNNGDDKEKSGKLEFLSPTKETLFTLSFSGLGIYKLAPSAQTAGVEAVRRLTASMYCEEMAFAPGAGA